MKKLKITFKIIVCTALATEAVIPHFRANVTVNPLISVPRDEVLHFVVSDVCLTVFQYDCPCFLETIERYHCQRYELSEPATETSLLFVLLLIWLSSCFRWSGSCRKLSSWQVVDWLTYRIHAVARFVFLWPVVCNVSIVVFFFQSCEHSRICFIKW
jgi:hypothetical protein